jgi:hypothetical protein
MVQGELNMTTSKLMNYPAAELRGILLIKNHAIKGGADVKKL